MFETGDDEEASMRVKDFGLVTVAYVIAKHRRSGLLTVEDKVAEFEMQDPGFKMSQAEFEILNAQSGIPNAAFKIMDTEFEMSGADTGVPDAEPYKAKMAEFKIGSVRTTFKKQSSPKNKCEFFDAARVLLQALVDENIPAYTIHAGITARKIDAMDWQGREFRDERRDGHYHVVAAAAGHEPLRSIRFKKDDIFQRWPPEGGQKRGPKAGRTSEKDIWCSMAVEMLVSGEVQPKLGVKIAIAKCIWERGYRGYQPNTIAGCISKIVNDWIAKHEAT